MACVMHNSRATKSYTYQNSSFIKDSEFNMDLFLVLITETVEKNNKKLGQERMLSEFNQAIHKLEAQKSVLESRLFAAWSDRGVSSKVMDDLLWKMSDISVAIKVNKAGGLALNNKSLDELKSSLTVICIEVGKLNGLLLSMLFLTYVHEAGVE